MVIKRIPLRAIRKDFVQFLSIIMLVAIASMIYTLFAVSMDDISENYEAFIKSYIQEDGYFITSKEIDEGLLEDKFGIVLEQRLYYEIRQDEIAMRIFSITEEINKPYVGIGEMPKEGEVLLDPGFFKSHGYQIGDEIIISGQKFKVSGVGYLPDYIYIIKNDQDLLPDPDRFGVVMMLKSDVQRLFATPYVHYYSYKGQVDVKDLKNFINSNWGLMKFVERDKNPRIIYTEMKVENAKRITLPISLFIIIVSSFILFIVMRRVINTMHAEIGTLYSMGYTQKDVFMVFMRFPLYIWLLGSIIGILLGLWAVAPFAEFYRSFFTLPKITSYLPWQHVFVALFLPAIFIFLAGYLALKGFFRLTIIQMLHGVEEIKFSKLPAISFFDRFEFRTRIMLKYGWRHIAREIVLALGIMFSTILMMFGMTAKDYVIAGIEKAYSDNFKYSYIYILNSISEHSEIEVPHFAEPYNILPFDVEGTKASVMIYGIKNDSEMVKLHDAKGKEIPVSDKLIISKPLANKLGLREGDELRVKNEFTGKEYALQVYRIADLAVGNNGYMELESFNRLFGFSEGEYAGIFSKRKIDIPEDLLFQSYTQSELKTTIKASAQDLSKTIGVMSFMAAIFALLIIYVLSNLTLSENRKNIGILKMLGYRESSIFKMMLGFNYISFLVGFVVGVPLSKFTMDSLLNAATKDIDFAMSLDLSLNSVLSTLVILLLVFIFSRLLVKAKIEKVMPIDILRQQGD